MTMASEPSEYLRHLQGHLARLQTAACRQALVQAAGCIVAAVRRGGWVHLYDSGHMLTHELVGRAGGLMLFNPIEVELKLTHVVPAHRPTATPLAAGSIGDTPTGPAERGAAALAASGASAVAPRRRLHLDQLSGVAEFIASQAHWQPGDVLLVGSVTGVSILVVELARLAVQAGLHLIALTSVAASQAVPAVHPSGKRLYELAEVVLDHGAPPEDAVLAVDGLSAPICPVSGVLVSATMWALTEEVARQMVAAGLTPSLLVSNHLPGATEFNAMARRRYQDLGY